MKEGCQLSYEFLADNGEKEVRADGGIFEPLYYQVDAVSYTHLTLPTKRIV